MNLTDSDEIFNHKLQYRRARWENVIKQQFQLAYFGKIDYSDTQDMPVFEREYLFHLLVEQKDAEAKQMEDAKNKSKPRTNTSGARSRPRHHHK